MAVSKSRHIKQQKNVKKISLHRHFKLKAYIIFFITELDGKETKLLTWSTKSTKLLISGQLENEDPFAQGKICKNVAWQRIAEKFNLTSSVKVTEEQCPQQMEETGGKE